MIHVKLQIRAFFKNLLLLDKSSVKVNNATGILEEMTGGTGNFVSYLAERFEFTYAQTI